MTTPPTAPLPPELLAKAAEALRRADWMNWDAEHAARVVFEAANVPGLLAEVAVLTEVLREMQQIAAEAQRERDEARAALAFLMRDVDAVAGVSNKDRYDFAVDVARERGHEEPTAEDELDGFLRLIVEARRVLGGEVV